MLQLAIRNPCASHSLPARANLVNLDQLEGAPDQALEDALGDPRASRHSSLRVGAPH